MELQLQSWYTAAAALVVLGILYYIRRLRENDNYWKDKGLAYQPRMSVLGLLWVLCTKQMTDIILSAYQKYGRVHGRFEGKKPALTIADPDILRDVLVKDFHAFNMRRDFDVEDNLFGKMVSVLTGEDWKRVRMILTPAFTSKKMRKMVHIINSCTETVLRTFKEHTDKGISIDCRKVFGAFTMDVIASSAFATKIDSHHDPDNPFVTNARNFFTKRALFNMIMFFLLPDFIRKLFGIQFFYTKSMNFFRHVTLQVIEERRLKGQKGNDFLQMMLDVSDEIIEGEKKVEAFKTLDMKDEEEDQFGRIDNKSNIVYTTKKLSQDEIVAQCVLFFVVGYETSALTLSYVAYCLATNPACQEKLAKEVDDAFDKGTEITYDVIRDMKYLDGVISETLRMFPALLASERTATEDYTFESLGISVPKGTMIQFPIYAMHYDPEFFPEPETFKPERFIGSDRENYHPYAYLPFGAGPRNCLGMRFALMEIKLCVAHVIRNYRLRPAPETKIPPEFIIGSGFLTTKDLPLLAEKRTHVKVK